MKKIKILHVYTIMNRGGAETFIMNVFRNIDRDRYQFDFLCTSNGKGDYDDEILSLGGHIYHYDSFSQKNVFKVICDTKKIIKEHGPYDVIHIQFQFYSAVYCIAAKIAGIKQIIVHSHNASDKDNNGFVRKIYFTIARKVIGLFSTNRLACGEKSGRFLFGNNMTFQTIYNGMNIKEYSKVDIEKMQQLISKYELKNKLIIGHVGRFEKQKNHDFFIKIAKEFLNRKVDFKIILVGRGTGFDEFKNKVRKENLDNYFIFAGIQQETNVYYKLFNVLVMPSLYEGFPVSIVESLACGTPCVLSDTITKEVNLIDNMCSFISLNDDIKKWCDVIIDKSKITCDRNKCVKILEEKGFSINSTIEKITNVYLNK